MDVSKHLEKAQEAARKKNFDYAISLYHQVLQLKPDLGDARRELRQVLVRRAEYKRMARPLAAAQGVFSRLSMVTTGLTGKPEQVALAAEKYLVNDPHNRRVNMALAQALEKAGHLNSAVAVYEFVGDDAEAGDEALKKAGALYYALKRMDRALGCYETVLKRSPRDSEAEKARKNLAAEGVLSSGSYDPTRSSRELARDAGKLQERELDGRLVTSEDQREQRLAKLRATLDAGPGDRRARKELVDLLVRGRAYAEAIDVVEQGLSLEPDSYEWQERRGDLTVLHLEQELRDARRLAEQGDEAARTDVVDLERELADFEMEETERRVAAHPTDLGLRHKLGMLLLARGAPAGEFGDATRLDHAISHLQLAVKDPRRKIDALLGLADAFQAKGLTDLARKQLEAAMEAAGDASDRATEVQYALGVLLERSGDVAAARARFEEIYERDIHFRDVAARIEALRARQAPPPPPRASTPAPAESPARAPDRAPEEEPPTPPRGGATYGFKD